MFVVEPGVVHGRWGFEAVNIVVAKGSDTYSGFAASTPGSLNLTYWLMMSCELITCDAFFQLTGINRSTVRVNISSVLIQ